MDGLDADDQELVEQHECGEVRTGGSRVRADHSARGGDRRRNAVVPHSRRGTRRWRSACAARTALAALLGAKDRLAGLLGPAAGLLTVAPGYEVAVAAALGTAADAIAVTDPATAADAIRLLRTQDAGRAALLPGAGVPGQPNPQVAGPAEHAESRTACGQSHGTSRTESHAEGPGHAGRAESHADGCPEDRCHEEGPAQGRTDDTGPDTAAARPQWTAVASRPLLAVDLVRGSAELLPAVRGLLRDIAVVVTLEDAEELIAARPVLTAVTAEGDVLGAHFAHGGSAGAPSLIEVQASVDEAARRTVRTVRTMRGTGRGSAIRR